MFIDNFHFNDQKQYDCPTGDIRNRNKNHLATNVEILI